MSRFKITFLKVSSVIAGSLIPFIASAEEAWVTPLYDGIVQIKTDLFSSISANLPAILAVFGALLIISVVVRFVRRLVGGR